MILDQYEAISTFHIAVSKAPLASSNIRLWKADYEQQGTHADWGGNGAPRISMQTKNDMRQLFQDNPRVSLRAAAVETSIAHATIWNFLEGISSFPLQSAKC